MNPYWIFVPGSKEREYVLKEMENIKKSKIEIPLIINGKEYKTEEKAVVV